MRRAIWLVLGLVCVGFGGIGVVVPGLPTTVFFIGAAACFTRSSPRLEAWVLDLPGIGPMVRDYRAGRGMPRRAKAWAVGSILLFAGLAVVLALGSWWTRGVVAALALTGVAVVAFWVPTTERLDGPPVGDAP